MDKEGLDPGSLKERRQLYLTGLLNEMLPPDWVDTQLEGLLGLPENARFTILHFHLDNRFRRLIDQLPPEEAATWKTRLQEVFEDFPAGTPFEPVAFLNLLPYTRTLVLAAPSDLEAEAAHSLLEDAFGRFVSTLRKLYGASVAGFAGTLCGRIAEISPSYKKLRQLAHYRFVSGMGVLVHQDDGLPGETVDLVDYKYLQYFQDYLENHDCRQALATVDELVESLKRHRASDSRAIYIFKELIGTTIRLLYAQQQDYELIGRLNAGITDFDRTFDDIGQVRDWLGEILPLCLEDEAARGASHPHLHRILHIIEEAYGSELSLQQLASQLHVTDSYLSRLFKEELDVNFKDYLTAYRMKKAKELLASTSLSIKDIGQRVGYPVPIAFTRAFKNHEGITPRDFRNLS